MGMSIYIFYHKNQDMQGLPISTLLLMVVFLMQITTKAKADAKADGTGPTGTTGTPKGPTGSAGPTGSLPTGSPPTGSAGPTGSPPPGSPTGSPPPGNNASNSYKIASYNVLLLLAILHVNNF